MIPLPTMAASDTGNAAAHVNLVGIRGTRTASATGTSLATVQPSGAAAGDYGLFVYRIGGQASTPPSGWANSAGVVYTKTYVSNEPNPTVSPNTSATDIVTALLVLYNIDPTTPIDASSNTSFTSASGLTLTGGSVTSTVINTLYVSVFMALRNTASALAVTPPTGMTLIGPTVNNTTTGVCVAMAYKSGPASVGGTVTSPTWTMNQAAFSAAITNLLIRPAP